MNIKAATFENKQNDLYPVLQSNQLGLLAMQSMVCASQEASAMVLIAARLTRQGDAVFALFTGHCIIFVTLSSSLILCTSKHHPGNICSFFIGWLILIRTY